MEEVAKHLPLDMAEIADRRDFALMAVDRLLDLVAERRFAFVAEKEGAETSPEAAPIRLGADTRIFRHLV
jgi:hypothetical protein